MKRFIICFVLAISIMLSLCSCRLRIVGERSIMDGFVVINIISDYNYIVYNQTTKVVYYFEDGNYGGYLSPYFIYQNGALYGAIFQSGEIIPVPYAYAPLE